MAAADRPAAEQPALLLKKLQQCCVVFDFSEATLDIKGKEVKRAALNELVEYFSKQGVLSDPVYPELIRMVRGVEGRGALGCCSLGCVTLGYFSLGCVT